MKIPLQLWLAAAGLMVVVGALTPVSGQDAAFEKDVNKAVDRGVEHLTKMQGQDGSWPHDRKGATALAAWALLECAVSPNDERITKAADAIREHALTIKSTYEISLAIFFLDRLGDPEDAPLIEALALRLMYNQLDTYGWGYVCPPLANTDILRLQNHVEKLKKMGPRKLPEKPAADKKPRDPRLVHPNIMAEALQIYNNPWPMPTAALFNDDPTDNSNTQFAMLALWVAKRYGMPVDNSLRAAEMRFRQTQRKSGAWSYHNRPKGGEGYTPTATMTACGLISLALGNACTPDKFKRDLSKDPQVKNALYVLAASIGGNGLPGNIGGKAYYFLWTLERMAVIYGFKTIGDKDWYLSGAQQLLASQQQDGSWRGEFGDGGVDTSFALLFLKKANVARDLTMEKKVKDPGPPSKELLDLIGRDVGDLPKKKEDPKKEQRKKNSPEQQPSPPPSARVPKLEAVEGYRDEPAQSVISRNKD
jgi:hypothetical protein